MNISERFIEFISSIVKDVNLDKIGDEIDVCILDYISCALAGEKILGETLDSMIKDPQENGNTPVIGKNTATTAISGALVNAIAAHVAELDDGHRHAMLHPGAPIISALISASSAGMIKDGRQFLKGVVAGYEVTCRLAQAIQPAHKLRGYHGTGTCGTVGAAFAVGIAAEFTKEQMMSTLSAAVTSAAGLLEMMDDSSQLKPYNVGQAAMNGYLAACIGLTGLNGPKDPLAGKRGFFNVLAGEFDEKALFVKEDTYKIQQRYAKAYAACRHCHPAIEAALNIVKNNKFFSEEIHYINVYTYKLAIHGHDQKEVQSVSAAKMSTPFSVATAVINKSAGLQAFEEDAILNKEILEIASKVYVYEDEQLTLLSSKNRAAIVTIYLKNGVHYSQRVDYPLGEPENPMTMDLILEKFMELGHFAEKSDEELEILIKATKDIKIDLQKWLNLL